MSHGIMTKIHRGVACTSFIVNGLGLYPKSSRGGVSIQFDKSAHVAHMTHQLILLLVCCTPKSDPQVGPPSQTPKSDLVQGATKDCTYPTL